MLIGLLLVLHVLRTNVNDFSSKHDRSDERGNSHNSSPRQSASIPSDQRSKRHVDGTAIGQVVG